MGRKIDNEKKEIEIKRRKPPLDAFLASALHMFRVPQLHWDVNHRPL